MLAENNPIIDEAASTIYSISQDSILLEQIRARDEAIAHENYLRKQMEDKDNQWIEKDSLIAKLLKENEELRRNQK